MLNKREGTAALMNCAIVIGNLSINVIERRQLHIIRNLKLILADQYLLSNMPLVPLYVAD